LFSVISIFLIFDYYVIYYVHIFSLCIFVSFPTKCNQREYEIFIIYRKYAFAIFINNVNLKNIEKARIL